MPTPSEPIVEQIMDAVLARFAALTAGATYWYTPRTVRRDWLNYDQALAAKDRPVYCLIEGPQVNEAEDNQNVRMRFTIIIAAWINDPSDRRQAVNRCWADLIRSVYTDETWGLSPTVEWTDMESHEPDEAALVSAPHAYFEMRLGVHYVRARSAA